MDEVIGGLIGLLVRQTARPVVWLITFGRWRGESLLGDEGRIHSAAGSLSFKRDGQRVITDTGLLFIGTGFYIALLLIFMVFVA